MWCVFIFGLPKLYLYNFGLLSLEYVFGGTQNLGFQTEVKFFINLLWLQVEELNTMAKEHEKNSEFKGSTSKNLLCEHKDSKVSYCALGLCETCFKHVSSFFLVYVSSLFFIFHFTNTIFKYLSLHFLWLGVEGIKQCMQETEKRIARLRARKYCRVLLFSL